MSQEPKEDGLPEGNLSVEVIPQEVSVQPFSRDRFYIKDLSKCNNESYLDENTNAKTLNTTFLALKIFFSFTYQSMQEIFFFNYLIGFYFYLIKTFFLGYIL